ncbi:MAG: DUF1674 domain-containing protein [Alphaproteobacteria bacterium]
MGPRPWVKPPRVKPMSGAKPPVPRPAPPAAAPASPASPATPVAGAPVVRPATETGGAPGPDPTRYGDWQHKGRVSDF